jgi:hypothetical protein
MLFSTPANKTGVKVELILIRGLYCPLVLDQKIVPFFENLLLGVPDPLHVAR